MTLVNFLVYSVPPIVVCFLTGIWNERLCLKIRRLNAEIERKNTEILDLRSKLPRCAPFDFRAQGRDVIYGIADTNVVRGQMMTIITKNP